MKIVQVLLIFAAIVGWSAAEKFQSANVAINKKLQRSIILNMDHSVNPCSDFYQYACGKWSEVHGTKYSSAVEMATYEANMDLIRYMDNTKMAYQPEFVQHAYELYTSCTGLDNFNELSYMNWLQEHENLTWALLSSSEEADANDKFDWVTTLATLQRYGLTNVFVGLYKIENPEKPSETLRGVNTVRLSFTSLTYDDLEMLSKAVILPEDNKPLDELWDEISQFEMELSEVEGNSEREKTTIENVSLSWLSKYIGIFWQEYSLDSSMEITINNLDYFKSLDELLQKYDDIFICRYLEVRFLWDLYRKQSEFTELDCMETTRKFLPATVDWIYAQIYPVLEHVIPEINEMFDHIIQNINETLRSDKKGIIPESFLSRFDTMQLKIGNYPRDDTVKIMDTLYADLTFGGHDFYGNLLQLIAFDFDTYQKSNTYEVDIKDINQFFDIEIVSDFPAMRLRFAWPQNVIYVPLALLRRPFYHWGYVDIYKYSTLGTMLANNVYNQLFMDGFTENELEKLSNVGSLHTSFETFFSTFPNYASKESDFHENEISYPMLFFVHAAQFYCGMDANNNPLNDIVSHLPEFTEAFQCKLNTFLEIFSHLSSN